ESTRENPDYLPGTRLPDALHATASLEEACASAEVLVLGVPSHGMRAVLGEARPFVGAGVPVVSLAKGIEQGTLARMTQVVGEVLVGHDPAVIGVLTGPNLAREVAAGQPTASVVATEDLDVATRLQSLFFAPTFRVYTNPDVVGCEVAGALKNVLAIGA